jgi:hypothetical protein
MQSDTVYVFRCVQCKRIVAVCSHILLQDIHLYSVLLKFRCAYLQGQRYSVVSYFKFDITTTISRSQGYEYCVGMMLLRSCSVTEHRITCDVDAPVGT